MKKLTCFLLLLLCCSHINATRSEKDSIFQTLMHVLAHKADYTAKKEQEISEVKQMLRIPDLTLVQYYSINRQLYLEYQPYQTDSATCYLQKNLVIAKKLNNIEYIYQTQIDLSYLLWQNGKFFEALGTLESLDHSHLNHLPEEFLRNYFEAYKRLYRYYSESQSDRQNDYYRKSNLYRDSLLMIVPYESKSYKVLTAEKLTDGNNTQAAKQILLDLLAESLVEDHERAIFANILANIYKKENNIEMQKKYYTVSAICDMKNAVKENTSMHALALILYREGDIDNAYKCIQSSMEDAVFCNARFRAYEITQIFPIIDSAYQEKAHHQKKQLALYLLLVSILSVFLVLAVIYVYRQMKRIARIRKELYRTNIKLQDLNKDLQDSNLRLHQLNNELTDVNRELSKTNLVKETYLAKFMDLCSSYIDKLDNYRRSLNKIASLGKVEELYAALKSSKYIDSELSEFYANFDKTFLQIYPTFIENFNALFPEENKEFNTRPGELLSKELRIYALIRLGINDSMRIAGFLRYSVATIYTYRSRLKSKSLFKELLEEKVMEIA